MAKRIVRLTESDMNRLVKKVIKEQKIDYYEEILKKLKHFIHDLREFKEEISNADEVSERDKQLNTEWIDVIINALHRPV